MTAVLVVFAGGLYFYLPTADITLTPRTQVAGPLAVKIVADPELRIVDAARLRIPADVHQIPSAPKGTSRRPAPR